MSRRSRVAAELRCSSAPEDMLLLRLIEAEAMGELVRREVIEAQDEAAARQHLRWNPPQVRIDHDPPARPAVPLNWLYLLDEREEEVR